MIILASFIVFVLAVLMMSLGVIFGGRRIQGSCGGLANLTGIESDCDGACRSEQNRQIQADKNHLDGCRLPERSICPRKGGSCSVGTDPANCETGHE